MEKGKRLGTTRTSRATVPEIADHRELTKIAVALLLRQLDQLPQVSGAHEVVVSLRVDTITKSPVEACADLMGKSGIMEALQVAAVALAEGEGPRLKETWVESQRNVDGLWESCLDVVEKALRAYYCQSVHGPGIICVRIEYHHLDRTRKEP